jgi:hypothetical protein
VEEAKFAEGQLVRVVKQGTRYFGMVGRVWSIRRGGKWYITEMPDGAQLLCFPGDLEPLPD